MQLVLPLIGSGEFIKGSGLFGGFVLPFVRLTFYGEFFQIGELPGEYIVFHDPILWLYDAETTPFQTHRRFQGLSINIPRYSRELHADEGLIENIRQRSDRKRRKGQIQD